MQHGASPSPLKAAAFLDALRGFRGEGGATRCFTEGGIPYFVNAFWTAKQRQGHPLHEISYRACFKAELPAFFIRRLTRPGNTVLDPFMGRGTTPLEAALRGRRAIGSDINPLSTLLVRPRLRPVTLGEVEDALAGVPWAKGKVRRPDLLAFYHPETLAQIDALQQWLGDVAPLADPTPPPAADWVRMVALNRLSGHSAGFFSGRSMPPNQAVSVAGQQRINARLGLAPPVRDVAALILKKTKSLLRKGPPPAARQQLLTASADHLPQIPDAGVDLVVTSPPFLDIVQYKDDNWLRCWFAGIDPAAVPIATHRLRQDWAAMVRATLGELARVLRPGGYVAFEVGEVRNGRVLLERLVWEATADLPFARLGVMVNAQAFTKTAHCWGVANNRRGTNSNRIVLLERTP